MLGITFKENCPDIRNSKVIDIFNELHQFGLDADVYDPHADANEVSHEYGINLVSTPLKYDAVILAVAHDEFIHMNMNDFKKSENCIVFDIKAILDRNQIDGRL